MAGSKRKATSPRGSERDARRPRLSPTPAPSAFPLPGASTINLPILTRDNRPRAGSEDTVMASVPASNAARDGPAVGSERPTEGEDELESEEEDEEESEDEDEDDEDEEEGPDEMFSAIMNLPDTTAQDKAARDEEERRVVINRIIALSGKKPRQAIGAYYWPQGALVLPSSAVCNWNKNFLDKLAEVFAYATAEELNEWLAETAEERMVRKDAGSRGNYTSLKDLTIYLAKCKKEEREGKRQMKWIED